MYAKIVNETTKEVSLAYGNKIPEGYSEIEVEQAYNGSWYVKGCAPEQPKKTYVELRKNDYPSIEDQLDMIYWDKVNNTNYWHDKIAAIKNKYPKA